MDSCTGEFFYCLFRYQPVAIVAALGLIIASLGILVQRKSWKQKNSLEFEANYSKNKKIIESYTVLDGITKSQMRDAVKAKNILDDKSAAMTTILNVWERAANAIYKDIFDEEYLYQMYCNTVIGIYNKFYPFIQGRRDYRDNPRLFILFERLALKWSYRRQEEDNDNIESALKYSHSLIKEPVNKIV